jgi:signal transduction histidine kinase
LLYTSLFAVGGAALVSITYLLVAHTLNSTTPGTTPPSIRPALESCLRAASRHGGISADVMRKCADVYASGVHAGAAAQRSTTLTHLLIYSLFTLACVVLVAAVAGWIVAGRILQPVRRITAAARAASEQNLSQRIALQGPRDELVSMAADVRQAVDHSERLIEVLLILARNEQARVLTEPLDLAAVAEDALEGRKANGVTTMTALEEAPVIGDRVLLERLVANLVDNAERYNVVGGTVTISTTTDDGGSVMRVANTGPVVPPEQVDRLFTPFARLDNRTRHDGFGLGLTLVASIAAVHGGTVEANATPTGGLDVSVRLPRRDTAVTPASPVP